MPGLQAGCRSQPDRPDNAFMTTPFMTQRRDATRRASPSRGSGGADERHVVGCCEELAAPLNGVAPNPFGEAFTSKPALCDFKNDALLFTD